MGLIAKEGSNVVPVSEGVYQAICYAIFDLGTQFSEKFGKSSHQMMVIWEIPEERIEITRDDKVLDLPRVVSKKYTMSLNEKANLRKDLQSWRGKTFTPEELAGFDVTKLLGVNCMIQIIHTKTDSKTYANIASITPLYKGMEKKFPENPAVIFDLSKDRVIPETTPKWIRELIEDSAEWKALQPEVHDEVREGVPF
jgi:hypothetical protein